MARYRLSKYNGEEIFRDFIYGKSMNQIVQELQVKYNLTSKPNIYSVWRSMLVWCYRNTNKAIEIARSFNISKDDLIIWLFFRNKAVTNRKPYFSTKWIWHYVLGGKKNSGNFRTFVLDITSHTCILCGKYTNVVHEIVYRSQGVYYDVFSPANRVSLCRACHAKVHDKIISAEDLTKRYTEFLSQVDRNYLVRKLISFGFIPEFSDGGRRVKLYIDGNKSLDYLVPDIELPNPNDIGYNRDLINATWKTFIYLCEELLKKYESEYPHLARSRGDNISGRPFHFLLANPPEVRRETGITDEEKKYYG